MNYRNWRSILPQRVATQLGLRAEGETVVIDSRGGQTERALVSVVVLAYGRMANCRAIVDPDRAWITLGRLVLDELDLVVEGDAIVPKDPDQYTAIIEYAA